MNWLPVIMVYVTMSHERELILIKKQKTSYLPIKLNCFGTFIIYMYYFKELFMISVFLFKH